MVDLTSEDLVISDEEGVLALAGIRGGKKDSVLDSTTGVLVEIANFEPSTIIKDLQKRLRLQLGMKRDLILKELIVLRI